MDHSHRGLLHYRLRHIHIHNSLVCSSLHTSKSSLLTNSPAYVKTTQFIDICEFQVLAVYKDSIR